MSIIAFPPSVQTAAEHIDPVVRLLEPPRQSVRPILRRGTIEQGRALESLGHAVEYLIDSSLFAVGEHNQRDEQESVQILMRMSRAVFAECPEVVSVRRRMRRWVSERFSAGSGIEHRG